jgi:hypothetical protein
VNRRRKGIVGTAIERARAKISESRFFLDEMEKNKLNAKEFGYNLSAFLSAFKSIADLSPRAEVESLRRSDSEIDFLMEQRNVEVRRNDCGVARCRSLVMFLNRLQSQNGTSTAKSVS